jgi:hypothetical protein
LYYTDTTPATHAVTRTNEVTAEGEEEEEEDEDEDEDVGGDAGLHNRSSAHPGTASPLMQPCPHARDTSSEASLVSRHGVDAKG